MMTIYHNTFFLSRYYYKKPDFCNIPKPTYLYYKVPQDEQFKFLFLFLHKKVRLTILWISNRIHVNEVNSNTFLYK